MPVNHPYMLDSTGVSTSPMDYVSVNTRHLSLAKNYGHVSFFVVEGVLPKVAELFERVVVNTDMVSAAYIATTDSQQIDKVCLW